MLIIQDDVLVKLAVLPAESQRLVIAIPGEDEEILLDDLLEAGVRVLRPKQRPKSEFIVARSLPDAFALLGEAAE